jgi:hypothetical protein
MVEIYWKSKRIEQARTVLSRIDKTLLYPVQADWLKGIAAQIGAEKIASTGADAKPTAAAGP